VFGRNQKTTARQDIIRDVCIGDSSWQAVVLRYFNPVGAHASGLIGEDPLGIPNNLMPYVAKVASGALQQVTVHGDDYDTPDGTGVRDYVHVMDLADGHVSAVRKVTELGAGECKVYNLGTGRGTSVKEMVRAVEKASGKTIPTVIGPRRTGDVGTVYADCSLASKELGWTAKRGVDEMCADLWKWQSANPRGYAD